MTDTEEKKSDLTKDFNEINKEFLSQIESIREVLPLMMIFINANTDKANKDLINYVKANGKSDKDEKGEIFYTFSPEASYNVNALQKNAEIAATASDIIPNSLFVSMISQYDCFVGKLIRHIFEVKPQILNTSEKNLTFSKLIELNSIEEAKELIIEKEVEAVLRESHSAHFDWLEEKLKLELRKGLPAWQTFIEITERRNLFVHCNGVVSSQYLSTCKKNKVSIGDDVRIGKELSVSREYFESSFKCLYEISTKLTQVIWRKLIPLDLEKADQSLNDVCFELIKNGQYTLADNLLDFATQTLPRHYNEETKNVFIINQALSLKLGGNKDSAEKIITSKDWSATSNKFKIAKDALLDDFESVGRLMKIIGSNGEISKLSYKAWPLFLEFRKTSIFTDVYKEVFNEDYTSLETPKKMLDQIIAQAANKNKQKSILNISSFLEVTQYIFPTYQFTPYKAEAFINSIIEKNNITKAQFDKALKDNVDIVKSFNDHLVITTPTNYLNPYTMIRHCLFLFDSISFKGLLFDVQIKNFESWLKNNNNKPSMTAALPKI